MFGMYDAEERQAVDEAARNPTTGPPLTFGETFESAYDAQRAYQQSFSEQASKVRVLDDVIGKFRAATGEDMPNPLIVNPPTPDERLGLPQPPQTAVTAALPTIPKARQRYEEVRATRPELGLDPFPTDDEITARSDTIRRQARETYERGMQREHSGVADFLGSAAGSMTDPTNIGAMLLAGPAARTIIGEALVQGAVGAASQAAVSGLNYQARTRIDPNYTPGMAAGEIAAAGVGGAVLGGGIKGLGVLLERFLAGTDRATLPRSLNDAINVVQSDARDAEKTPFPTDAGANAVHQETVDNAVTALRTSDTAPVVIPPEAIALEPRIIGHVRENLPIIEAPAAVARPPSLIDFLSRVGIRDESGELAHMGIGDLFIPGRGRLVRKNGGLTLDEAREAAVEAGYIQDAGWDNPDVQAQTNVSDFLDALAQDHTAYRSKDDASRVFSQRDETQAAAFLGGQQRRQLDAQLADFIDMAKADGHAVDDRQLMEYAAAHYLKTGGTVDDAIERAAISLGDETGNLRPVLAEQVPGWEDVVYGPAARGDSAGVPAEGGGGAGRPAAAGPAPTAGTAVRDAGTAGSQKGPLADPTIGGLAARDLTEDAIRQAAKEPDAALAEVHAAEHLAEQAAADGRPLMVAVEDGQAPRDVRDILREADEEEAMATEIGNCVIDKGPMGGDA